MPHLPAIPTIPGELTELATEFNEGEAGYVELIDILRRAGKRTPRSQRRSAGMFFRYWRFRKAQIKLIVVVKLSGMEI